jgi:hypothetical protein
LEEIQNSPNSNKTENYLHSNKSGHEGTQAQTSLIQEQEQLKVAKLREEIEKQGYEIQAISYEKEKLKQETEAKF